MKRITVLAVAAIAALASLVVVGASAASANVLCKKNEDPCKYENLIPEGTTIVAEAKEPRLTIATYAVNITCPSKMEATVGAAAENGRHLSITSWKLGNGSEWCNGIGKDDCAEVNAQNLPYSAELTNDGFFTTGPSWHLKCYSGGIKYIDCTYYEEATKLQFDHHAFLYQSYPFSQSGTCGGTEPHLTATMKIVQPASDIYVVDDGPGPPEATTGGANHITAEGATVTGSVYLNGVSTSYWFEYGKTTGYGSKIPVTAKELGSGFSTVGVSQTLSGLSNSTYHYRLVAKNSLGEEAKGGDKTVVIGPPSYRSSFGSSSQFGHPAGIAMDQSGELWVADEEKNQIQRWSTSGTLKSTLYVAKPSDVAVDSEGNLWVADKENDVVFALTHGSVWEVIAVVGEGELVSPEAIAIDPEGDVWVADAGLNMLLEYDREGNLLIATEELINEPTGVAVSPNGKQIYVANYGSEVFDVISRYNQEGKGKEFLGFPAWNSGQASSIDVDSEGNLWVTSDSPDRVREFRDLGQKITEFGYGGTGSGQFQINTPGGILVDSEANIWVTDQGNHRVQKWSR